MKKMKHQVTVKSFIWVEVNTRREEKIIKDLNNEFDKEKKRNRTYKKNTISASRLENDFMYELPDNSPTIVERLITRERDKQLHSAIKQLPRRQKETIIEHFYQDKSLRQIAREKKISEKTVRESYHSGLEKLKKLIKK